MYVGKYTLLTSIDSAYCLSILTLNDIKKYLRIPQNIISEDDKLQMLLQTGVYEFIKQAQTGILDLTYKAHFTNFSNYNEYISKSFRIYRQKIHTINHIKYLVDNTWTLLDSNDYNIIFTKNFTAIESTCLFPKLAISNINKPMVEIEFISGYASTALEINPKIKQALLSYISFYYNNNGDCGDCDLYPGQFNTLMQEFKYNILL